MHKHSADERVWTFLRKGMGYVYIDVCSRHVLETTGQFGVNDRMCTDRSKTAANVIVSKRVVARWNTKDKGGKRDPISDFDSSWKNRRKLCAKVVVKKRKRTLFNLFGIYVFIRYPWLLGAYATGDGVRSWKRSATTKMAVRPFCIPSPG